MAEETVSKHIILGFSYEKNTRKMDPKSVKMKMSKIGFHSRLSWSGVDLEPKFFMNLWLLVTSWTKMIMIKISIRKNYEKETRIRKKWKFKNRASSWFKLAQMTLRTKSSWFCNCLWLRKAWTNTQTNRQTDRQRRFMFYKYTTRCSAACLRLFFFLINFWQPYCSNRLENAKKKKN